MTLAYLLQEKYAKSQGPSFFFLSKDEKQIKGIQRLNINKAAE